MSFRIDLNQLYRLKEPVCFISKSKDYRLLKDEIIKLCKIDLLNRNDIKSLLDYVIDSETLMSDILLYQYKFLYQEEILLICLSPNEFKKLFRMIN